MIEPHAHTGRKPVIPTLDEYQRLYRLSLDEPEVFWAQQAEETDLVPPVAQRLRQRLRETSTSAGTSAAGSTPATTASTGTSWSGATRPRSSGPRTSPASTSTSPTASSSTRSRGWPTSSSPRRAQGRPRHRLPADDPRAGLRDAGLRAHRRRALGGLRRLLRRVAARPHPRRRRQGRGHRQRGPARRQACST